MGFVSSLLLTAVLQGTTPARVVVEPAVVEMDVGDTQQLAARATDASGDRITGATYQWLSEDPNVVTVDGQGKLTGVAPGTTRVAAVVSGQPGTATVTVRQLPPARIELDLPTTNIPVGTSAPLGTRLFTARDAPLNTTMVTYEVEPSHVASVDATGRVYGRQTGSATVRATAGTAVADLVFTVTDNAATDYQIEPGMQTVRTGDVVRFETRVFGSDGVLDEAVFPAWSTDGVGAQIEAEGPQGVFVANAPGTYRVTAVIGENAVRQTVVSVVQRHVAATLTTVGRGSIADHHSGDTWVFAGVDGRDYAYIGTFMHDWMKVWDVTNPGTPALTDSIQLDARRINDVKIHPNNRIGILTREQASDRRNGIVILDLSTPAHPTILAEYTETVTGGVHNVWIRGTEDLVYAAHNGTSDMHIIDIADPANPKEVGRWGLEKTAKTLHDVIVQDGYAYLSYWDDGVIMLDVGAGTHRGTATNPVFVSQFKYPIGNTHVAWRAGRYLFIGDEIFPTGWNADRPIDASGYVHVVDYQDPENPVEVARYEVPEAGAHNMWVDGDRMYVGYYQAGLRVVDISGELRGDLYNQGREIAVFRTTDENTTVANWSMTWGAQLFKGNIYTSDLNSGLWILKLQEETVIP